MPVPVVAPLVAPVTVVYAMLPGSALKVSVRVVVVSVPLEPFALRLTHDTLVLLAAAPRVTVTS